MTRSLNRRAVVRRLALSATAATFGAALFAALPASARADNWPERPIKLIVPFAPGGNTDIVARLITQDLSKALGQPVVVENKSGASGNLGADAVAKSAPDGYTLLMGTVGTQAINLSVYRKIPYGLKDFAPVTLIASVPNVLVVNENNPAKSVADLVANAKKAGQLSFASSGAGSSIHLSGELFKSITGLPMTHVAYRGSGPALTDLIGGQVELMFDNLPTSLPYVQAGKLRALAVTSAERTVQLPDVPTMVESGYPGFELGSWFGVLAPAGTPAERVEKINASLQKIANEPAFQQRLVELGAAPLVKGPADFQAFIEAEHAKWGAVVKASGAALD